MTIIKKKATTTRKPVTKKVTKTKANQQLEKMLSPEPKKEEKVQEAQVSKNTSRAIQQTVINRELKWLYPEDCLDTLSRKAFRQKARNAIAGLEKQIFNLQNNEEAMAKMDAKERKTQIQILKEQSLTKRKQYLANPMAEI